jgi:hypothetical protein
VVGLALKDWRNLGAFEYEKLIAKTVDFRSANFSQSRGGSRNYKNGWDYYNELKNRQDVRRHGKVPT